MHNRRPQWTKDVLDKVEAGKLKKIKWLDPEDKDVVGDVQPKKKRRRGDPADAGEAVALSPGRDHKVEESLTPGSGAGSGSSGTSGNPPAHSHPQNPPDLEVSSPGRDHKVEESLTTGSGAGSGSSGTSGNPPAHSNPQNPPDLEVSSMNQVRTVAGGAGEAVDLGPGHDQNVEERLTQGSGAGSGSSETSGNPPAHSHPQDPTSLEVSSMSQVRTIEGRKAATESGSGTGRLVASGSPPVHSWGPDHGQQPQQQFLKTRIDRRKKPGIVAVAFGARDIREKNKIVQITPPIPPPLPNQPYSQR